MIPQIIILSLMAIWLLLAAHQHGKENLEKKYNFWIYFSRTIFLFILLYWGHFFDGLFN